MTAQGGNFAAPADQAIAIVNDVAFQKCRAIYVGGGGDISVVMGGVDGNTVIFKSVATGTILPVMATKVTAANTTATNLVALF